LVELDLVAQLVQLADCLAPGAAIVGSLELVCAQVFESGPVGEHVPDRRDQ
jgi:hypothetical protein